MKQSLIYTVLLAAAILISTKSANSQERNRLSAEINGNYHYYVMENTTGNYGYGFSGLLIRYIHKLKVSAGVNYTVKSFATQGDHFYFVDKYNYTLTMINYPLAIEYLLATKGKYSFYLSAGLIFHQITNYEIELRYVDGDAYTISDLTENSKLGLSVFAGPSLSRSIGEKWKLNLFPVIQFKAIPDYDNTKPSFKNLPEDRFSAGVKLGIEYVLSNK